MLSTLGRRALCRRLPGIAAVVVSAAAGLAPLAAGAASLNALVWCDHADPALLGPFEDANDVTVNVKEYEGTGAGLAIVEQSRPGDWDVMVIDSIDVRRGVEQGLFAPLPEDQLPLEDLIRRCGWTSSRRPTASATASPKSSVTTRSASTGTRSTSRICRP
jgi:spermidine/putrescine-binding protein